MSMFWKNTKIRFLTKNVQMTISTIPTHPKFKKKSKNQLKSLTSIPSGGPIGLWGIRAAPCSQETILLTITVCCMPRERQSSCRGCGTSSKRQGNCEISYVHTCSPLSKKTQNFRTGDSKKLHFPYW